MRVCVGASSGKEAGCAKRWRGVTHPRETSRRDAGNDRSLNENRSCGLATCLRDSTTSTAPLRRLRVADIVMPRLASVAPRLRIRSESYRGKGSHYMLVYDARQKVRRKFMAGKTAWSFGASAITRFITAACRFGSNKTIVAHCVSKSGLSNEWESNSCVC
ncbi:PREDICTED: uncharacterized protein LOC108684071 isoform X1 [Atta colombica]|uniref:uncharacterized protein LOC108684071 isoform X1 n=1 Tax=Atta colombica TaxID=520822 RepID=UPI00084CC8FC|nr:PREDICTED: uncharacterized protein LOC108684071 isoform X1 [Atta colombica]